GRLWSATCEAPSLRTQSVVSGRDAVAITVKPVRRAASWIMIEPTPPAPFRDLLVAVKAVSVNPVDTKRRQWESPATAPDFMVLGYDAAGIVEAVGSDVSLFRPGDEVFYAGARDRPGTNAEFHLVDERIVGLKPKTLSFAEAAALPRDRYGISP